LFTGLVAELGSVSELRREGAGASITISCALAGELSEGDSVAVNGVCLTAETVGEGRFTAHAMAETLRRSSLGGLSEGDRVNLELPLRAQERLGGHVVQGHVDGVGAVIAVREEGAARVLEVEPEPQLLRYLVRKGSVALDGVSLTVSELGARSFEVSLIPETRRRTNLGALAAGDRVNVEVDVLAKHVERLLQAHAGEIASPGVAEDAAGAPVDGTGVLR
jgi:riboflavin synthase